MKHLLGHFGTFLVSGLVGCLMAGEWGTFVGLVSYVFGAAIENLTEGGI